MGVYFVLTMMVMVIPVLIILLFTMYPKNWEDRQVVLGVKNRRIFKEEENKKVVDDIVLGCHKKALMIAIGTILLFGVLLIFHRIKLLMTVAIFLMLISLLLMMLPFFGGNREMKDLKRRIGLVEQKGVTYVDLSQAKTIQAFSKKRGFWPFLAAVILFVINLVLVLTGRITATGRSLGLLTNGMFLLMNGFVWIMAIWTDRLRNEVISEDSDINANYNRAKKKNMSDLIILYMWITNLLALVILGTFFLWKMEWALLIGICLMFALLFFATGRFVIKNSQIEQHYGEEMKVVTDDDDCWIGGMIYYNPKDTRLNVNKRVGVGTTINVAHPAGKLISAVIGLLVLVILGELLWLGFQEVTPIRLSVEDNRIVCHQLSDEYRIPLSEIREATLCEDSSSLQLMKLVGTGLPNLYKGRFSEKELGECTVFFNPESKACIIVKTETKTYIISADTEEETREFFTLIR